MGRHASTHYRLEPTPALPDARGRGGAARAERGWAGHRPCRPTRAPGRPLGRMAGLDGGAEQGRARSDHAPAVGPPRRSRVARSRRREALLRGLLEGLLGADLVGFHTAAYMRHFASSLLRILGIAVDVDRAQLGERTVRLGVFPMGIDAARFARVAADPEVAREVSALRGSGDCAVLLAIDRLDYTKGIPRRLLAFDRLLRRHPSLREHVRLIQVAVPSRTHIEVYRKFRRHVDALVGRLNSAFATSRWAPVHYVYRSLSERELVALYRAADVMLVTPVRDGMNLVAKEFVAARTDEDGVLVLSEFAGAAAELAEALHVNPYDVDRTSEIYYQD